jgi:hypothetical protein
MLQILVVAVGIIWTFPNVDQSKKSKAGWSVLSCRDISDLHNVLRGSSGVSELGRGPGPAASRREK